MNTIRTVVVALLLGAGSLGTAFAAEPAQVAVQAHTASQPVVALGTDPELRAEMSERLDPRAVALIAGGIGLVGLVVGMRRRKEVEAMA
jgi:hypothetical protein